jgi:iron complex outermembrane receptor protein
MAFICLAAGPNTFAATLEEIQVTATKTTQSVQDIPIAVSAFTSESLDARGINETSDLTGLVPSLVVISPFGRTQPNFSLRGISVANEFNPNAASPIGIYVNEDYKQFRATHGMQLFDLDRIEVIRGPQGTLFGRNTTGGAISIFTKKPSFGELGDFSGYLYGSYGNYDRWSLEGAVETTLIEDTLAVRIAATATQGDGYIENVTPDQVQTLPDLLLGLPPSAEVNPVTDKDYASLDERALRATFALTPVEGFQAVLVTTFAESEPVASVPIVREFGPPDAAGNYANVFGYNREQFGANKDDQAASDSTGKSISKADDYTLTMDWDLRDDLTLTSITGYTDGELDIPHDCDGHPVATCFVNFTGEFDQFNQDLRLTWVGDRSSLIAGVYYGKDEIDTLNEEVFFGPLAAFAGFPTAAIGAIAPVVPLAAEIYDALIDAGLPAFPVFNPPVDSYILPPPDGLGAFQGDPDVLATGFRAQSQFTQERESIAIYAEGTYDFAERWRVTAGLRYTDDSFTLSRYLTRTRFCRTSRTTPRR